MVMAVVDVIKESFSGTSSTTIRLKQPAEGIVLRNKGTNNLILRINDIEIEVLAGEVFSGTFDSFQSLDVEASGSFSGYVTQVVQLEARPMMSEPNDVAADQVSEGSVRIETVTDLPQPTEDYSNVIMKLTGPDITEGFYLRKRLADNTYVWVQFG